MANPDGTITTRSNPVHLESLHPSVRVPISSYLDPAISGSNLNVQFGDSGSMDAFARLRVSNPAGMFDSQLQYDLHRLLWEDSVTNTSGNAEVTHNAAQAAAILTCEAQDSIIRQTRNYLRYQPGKSNMVLMTTVMGTGSTGVSRRVGYFDNDNGVFLQYDDGVAAFVVRSNVSGSVVNTVVAQSSWNLDKMTGGGRSGHTLDLSKAQIVIIDLEWLGVGRVRCGFVIDGQVFYCHEFLNANNLTTIYMRTANLPLRYELAVDAGVPGAHTHTCICGQVSSEGGFETARGLAFAATNGRTTVSVSSTARPILSIRPKATFNSIVNRALILPEEVAVFSEDQSAFYYFVYGGTLTGASWTSVADDSVVEYDVSATSLTGGIITEGDYVTAGNSTRGSSHGDVTILLPLALNIAGSHPTSPFTDSLTVMAVSMVAQSTDMSATMMWREVR